MLRAIVLLLVGCAFGLITYLLVRPTEGPLRPTEPPQHLREEMQRGEERQGGLLLPRMVAVATNYNSEKLAEGANQCYIASSVRQVCIVRVCGYLTAALKDMVSLYARQLAMSKQNEMWLLYDTGTSDTPNMSHIAEVRSLQKQYPRLGLFFYNNNAFAGLFPAAINLHGGKINWYFHDPSVVLWASHCHPSFFAGPPRIKGVRSLETNEQYVWVIEADALYVGNVNEFIDHHINVTADYIGADIQPVNPRWSHINEATWSVPVSHIMHKKDHVERFSITLLQFLFALLKLNLVAWSEVFAPTICSLQDHWCTMKLLQNRFVGTILQSSRNGSMLWGRVRVLDVGIVDDIKIKFNLKYFRSCNKWR